MVSLFPLFFNNKYFTKIFSVIPIVAPWNPSCHKKRSGRLMKYSRVKTYILAYMNFELTL